MTLRAALAGIVNDIVILHEKVETQNFDLRDNPKVRNIKVHLLMRVQFVHYRIYNYLNRPLSHASE